VAELAALWAWYRHVRTRLAGDDPLSRAVIAAGLSVVEANIDERLKQIDRFCDLVRECLPEAGVGDAKAALAGEWREFVERWPACRPIVKDYRSIEGNGELRERFCGRLGEAKSYTAAIQALVPDDRRLGTEWLRSIATELVARCQRTLPLITSA
jgi:hypothetical protein